MRLLGRIHESIEGKVVESQSMQFPVRLHFPTKHIPDEEPTCFRLSTLAGAGQQGNKLPDLYRYDTFRYCEVFTSRV
jgi:hypothetical protein